MTRQEQLSTDFKSNRENQKEHNQGQAFKPESGRSSKPKNGRSQYQKLMIKRRENNNKGKLNTQQQRSNNH